MRPLNAGAPDERRAHPRTQCSYKCRIARYKRGIHLKDLELSRTGSTISRRGASRFRLPDGHNTLNSPSCSSTARKQACFWHMCEK